MKILHQYKNGNTDVILYEDGTKERTYKDSPFVDHPESMDVKITNYCDAGCAYCHEQSTRKGTHADLNVLLDILKDIPAGVEIALGGGDPTSHPDLIPFLIDLKNKGVVCNITINQKHLAPRGNLILKLIQEDLVKGIGISYSSKEYIKDIIPILNRSNNVVFHLIMGINTINDVDDLKSICDDLKKDCKILVLGYKQYGFGINYYLKNKTIEDNKYQWYIKLPQYFKKDNFVISFDNLGIEQMNLQRFFTEESWNRFFMGNDFVFTMYIDAVEKTYAASSTSKERISFSEMKLLDFFKTYRKKI